MDLFELLGEPDLGFGKLTGETNNSKSKKKEKNEPQKKSAGKKTARKVKGTDFEVTLPVNIYARGFSLTIGNEMGENTIKVSDLFKKLDEMGYNEVRISGVNAAYHYDSANEHSVLYITNNGIVPDMENTQAEFKDGRIVICDGMCKCEVTPDDFPDLDNDEISISNLVEKWCSVESRYAGCRIICADGIAYPVFTVPLATNANVTLPADFLVNGEWKTLSENDFSMDTPSAQDVLVKLLGADTPEVLPQLYANLNKSAYFIGFTQKKVCSVAKGFSTTVTEKKAVKERYALPLKVFIATFGRTYELTTADFGGNEKVTFEEIKEYFKSIHKIFGDTSRKIDAIYLKEDNLLSLMFISGKKGNSSFADRHVHGYSDERESFGGYELLRTIKEMHAAITRPFFHGTLVNVNEACNGSIRVESFPHGTFFLTQNDETGDIVGLKFEMKLPKIPVSILNTIVTYFRQDLGNEAWVKICYNQKNQEYFIVKGNCEVTKTSVSYVFSSDGFINNRDIIQVMDIHSHNTMRAIFSMTDDKDECYPGIFGVIGRLDRNEPEMRFRAGYEGTFSILSKRDLFEEE